MQPAAKRRSPVVWIVALTVVALLAAFLLPAMRQPVEYHNFADHRHLAGVDNFLDVVSNAAFFVFGVWGLFILGRGQGAFEYPAERWPYLAFFIGLVLTAAGSAYYHLAPDNETLFWDRLPMTIAFMGLVSAQVVDRIGVRAGLRVLPPALLVGIASVTYWLFTERAGAGNVMPYGVLQGYTVIVVLLLALFNRSRYTHSADIFWVFGWYMLSKLLEHFDHEVLALNHWVSGHTLKHLAAAMTGFVVCRMLLRRRLRDTVQ